MLESVGLVPRERHYGLLTAASPAARGRPCLASLADQLCKLLLPVEVRTWCLGQGGVGRGGVGKEGEDDFPDSPGRANKSECLQGRDPEMMSLASPGRIFCFSHSAPSGPQTPSHHHIPPSSVTLESKANSHGQKT